MTGIEIISLYRYFFKCYFTTYTYVKVYLPEIPVMKAKLKNSQPISIKDIDAILRAWMELVKVFANTFSKEQVLPLRAQDLLKALEVCIRKNPPEVITKGITLKRFQVLEQAFISFNKFIADPVIIATIVNSELEVVYQRIVKASQKFFPDLQCVTIKNWFDWNKNVQDVLDKVSTVDDEKLKAQCNVMSQVFLNWKTARENQILQPFEIIQVLMDELPKYEQLCNPVKKKTTEVTSLNAYNNHIEGVKNRDRKRRNSGAPLPAVTLFVKNTK